MSALVLALTGTDHHPFDRMVQWIDAAASRRREVAFVVQHGATRPPSVAEGHDFLGQDDLRALLARAAVVVCHGGPGTIMDARAAGHLPLCVPRDPALGEHVDAHQQRFVTMVGGVGVVRDVRSQDALERELDDALLRGPVLREATPVSAMRDAARARAAGELDDLLELAVSRNRLLKRSRRVHL